MANTRANPFPGMNPFLEEYWSDVHPRLIVHMSESLQAQLPKGLFARVEESVAVTVDLEPSAKSLRADVLISHVWDQSGSTTASGGAAIAEPDLYTILESETYRYVEILDLRGGKVVTVIEILSPTNKRSGRQSYLDKRQKCLEAGVNFMEIDLLRGGRSVLPLALDDVPTAKRGHPYTIGVRRGDDPSQLRVWHVALMQPLPTVAVPLRTSDEDGVLELQPLLNRVFEAGGYSQLLDYKQ